MFRALLSLLALLAFAAVATPSPERPSGALRCDFAPDTSKAGPAFWPTAADLARLQSVEGKPKRTVLTVLGHPSAVTRRPDGTEEWRYPWMACCSVVIKDGVCVSTYYTGGY
jgi:hypothetical protein